MKTAPTPTREDAEKTMEKLARATYALAEMTARMDAEIADVRARYAMQSEALGAEIAATEKLLKDWAKRNRPADGKTIELAHGTIEIRLGTPAVKPAAGLTDAEVIARVALRPLWAELYLRPLVELNRERLLADRDTLTDDDLAEMGVRITQTERIHVTPKTEALA